MHLRRLVCFLVALACLSGALAAGPRASLAAGTGSISGTVQSATNNAPIQSASVQLYSAGASVTTTSGKDGSFSFRGLTAGSYYLRVTVKLYQANESAIFPLAEGQTISLVVIMQPVTTTNITSLGHVAVQGHAALNTSSAPTTTISAASLPAQGIYQVQDALDTTPGITIEHFDNGAPGNVATLTIRGAGGFVGADNTGYEVLVLQDGEPLRNGQYGDFDLSTLTPAIYSNVEVVKGVGGTSLFGANTIGGTVNFVTRDPSQEPGGELTYSTSGYGTSDLNLSGTDTVGKVGFLFDVHQYNTGGYIPPGYQADWCNNFVSATTYCGSYGSPTVYYITNPTLYFALKSALGKVQYHFSTSTYLTMTVTDESDMRDESGLLADGNTNGATGCYTVPCYDPIGRPYFYGYPGEYVSNVQPKYALDLHTVVGGGSLLIRAYHSLLYRIVDGENAATPLNNIAVPCCYVETETDRLTGEEAQWTKELGNTNTLTLAVGGNGDYFNYGEAGYSTTQNLPQNQPFPSTSIYFSGQNCVNLGWCEATQIERTYLVRDDAALTPQLDLTFAGYYSDYDTLNVKRFDPRLALVDKATQNTVIRASVGTGFAAPRISDLQPFLNRGSSSAVAFGACPMDEPYCAAPIGNPNLKEETATGYDLGFEQLFGYYGNGNVSVDLYRTDLKNHLFTGFEPAPPGTGNFTNGEPILFLNIPLNLAGTTYQGLESNATVPIGGYFAVNPYYAIQSAYPTGIPLLVEQSIGDVVNNQQYLGVPLHKLGWSFNYHSLSHLTTASFGADWYGPGNSYNTYPFWVYNASGTVPVGPAFIHVGWTNIFNTQAGLFEIFDGGLPYGGAPGCYLNGNGPCNKAGLYTTSMYNRAPHMLTITLDERWGSLR
jgi:outer membrane receptor protein involved in Fe transport